MKFMKSNKHKSVLISSIISIAVILNLVSPFNWLNASSTPKHTNDIGDFEAISAYALRESKKEFDEYNRRSSWNVKADNTTSVDQILIAIKSTQKNHATRLRLMLDTWIPQAFNSTFLITDADDNTTIEKFAEGGYVNTECGSAHTPRDLVCKLQRTFELFVTNNKKRWYCIVDDDVYLILPNLVKRLRKFDHEKKWYIGKPSLPHELTVKVRNDRGTPVQNTSFWFAHGGDGVCLSYQMVQSMKEYILNGQGLKHARSIQAMDDVLMGYIAHLLAVNLTVVEELHSHLEPLWTLDPLSFHRQISLSFGEVLPVSYPYKEFLFPNMVEVRKEMPLFPYNNDPTRLRSVHCHLFPDSEMCKRLNYSELTYNGHPPILS